jgi:hypothetical protein
MTRAILTASLLGLVAASAVGFALARSDGAAAQIPVPEPPALPAPTVPDPAAVPQTVLQVGDTIRVEGAAMGCQVTSRGGRPVLECRRDGSLSGTYGTFMSERKVTVARFRSSRTAQTILTARHGGDWRACGKSSSRGRAAVVGRGCR